jgi:REP element-mobilizing transposase RayT
MEEGVKRFDIRIPAFCLMSNHVHLAMQVADIPLSRVIQNLSFRYARYQNAKRQRTGHLFQGRYKAVLIDAESYLLE